MCEYNNQRRCLRLDLPGICGERGGQEGKWSLFPVANRATGNNRGEAR